MKRGPASTHDTTGTHHAESERDGMRRLALMLLAVVLVVVAACAPASTDDERPAAERRPTAERRPATAPLLVLAGPDASGWVRLLRASGAAAREGSLAELLASTTGVVGAQTPLTADQRGELEAWVRAGGRLVSPHVELLTDLDVERGAAVAIEGAEMDDLAEPARWPGALGVQPLVGDDVGPLATSGSSVLAGEAGRDGGAVLALAVDPLVGGRSGHELLPAIGRAVRSWTGAPDGPSRTGVEIYLDPGDLPEALVRDPDALAERLGDVRAVHIAGWNHDFNDPADDFDYAGLLDALHARGILGYAWLAPPFVSLRAWDRYPECRERTATGDDAEVDWRLLFALEDPACFAVALDVYRGLVGSFDFDGVNVAELYFEPPTPRAGFTPFHPAALARFGGDPAKDPEGFLRFRTDLITELNEQLLRELRGMTGADELDFQLTVIDDHLDPAMGRAVGSDTARLAAVALRQGATLQLEDPFTMWADGPLRYDALAPVLRERAGVRAFVDVNVVDRDGAHPTSRMTAGELDLAIASAGQVPGRLGLYSMGTVAGRDLEHVDRALAGAVETFDTGIQAPWTVLVRAPRPELGQLDVDGRPWPVADGVAVVPAGEHRLVWHEGPERGPGLLRATAEIDSLEGDATSLRFSYSTTGRGYAVVSDQPADVESVPNPDGGWTIALPAGNHTVQLTFPSAPPDQASATGRNSDQ